MEAAFLPGTVHAPKRRQRSAFGSASCKRKRAPVQQRCEACIAHVSDSTAGSGTNDKIELETLAREVLNREKEMQNPVRPGRPFGMPKVGALNERQVLEV